MIPGYTAPPARGHPVALGQSFVRLSAGVRCRGQLTVWSRRFTCERRHQNKPRTLRDEHYSTTAYRGRGAFPGGVVGQAQNRMICELPDRRTQTSLLPQPISNYSFGAVQCPMSISAAGSAALCQLHKEADAAVWSNPSYVTHPVTLTSLVTSLLRHLPRHQSRQSSVVARRSRRPSEY